MKPEPLKGKQYECETIDYFFDYFKPSDIKSAVKGLIKFHEDRIEELINEVKQVDLMWIEWVVEDIKREYESIMAIELWLEDVI